MVLLCEVVEISDDEESYVPENDAEFVPQDECLNCDLPHCNKCLRPVVDNVPGTSETDWRSFFAGMGFTPTLVNKVIEENGEGNAERLLEALLAYSVSASVPKEETAFILSHHDLQQTKGESCTNGLSGGGNDELTANPNAMQDFHKSESSDSLDSLFGEVGKKNAYCGRNSSLKEEPNVSSRIMDERMSTLLQMNFSLDEVSFAMDRLGKHASMGQWMDFIFAARMAKKYDTDTSNPHPGYEESEKGGSNEALFCIMEKTLQLLEMGFSECQISAAFEICGSEASMLELADSIVAPGTDINADKCYATFSAQMKYSSLKREMGDHLSNQPFDLSSIKTKEYGSSVASQVGTSGPIKKSKGKMPKEVYIDEPSWKKPKKEFTDNSVSSMGLEASENISPTINGVEGSWRRMGHMGYPEEDTKPTTFLHKHRKPLPSGLAKRPYFFYGSTTDLSHNSWARISQFLYSVQPEFVDTQQYSALSRTESYVHNLPTEDRFHIFPQGPMTIEEAIPTTKKWWPSWDNRKHISYTDCDTSGLSHLCDKLGRVLAESRGTPSAEHQRNFLQQLQEKNLIWVGNYKLVPLDPGNLESIMGYPLHHTRFVGFSLSERLKSLRLSFQTDALGYHLSVLSRLFPEGISVLSFFSGIGGAEVALYRLGIRLNVVVSIEPCETMRRILKKWWENTGQSGELIQMESIHKLSSSKLETLSKKFSGFDLVICQNPCSVADSDNRTGLDFSLFVEFIRVFQLLKSMMERNTLGS